MKPFVDFTLLKPDARLVDFEKLCQEAKKYPQVIRSVCVLPAPEIINLCFGKLAGTKIIVCAVNDFPLGRDGEKIKREQAILAKKYGAEEIDTVINASALREGQFAHVLRELKAVTSVFPKRTKVILETGHEWYTENLIKKATELVAKSEAFCVKTSTGFIKNIPVEEKVAHVKWMHEAAPELVKKIAGGVKTKKQAQLFFDILPADKIIFGASAKFWIID